MTRKNNPLQDIRNLGNTPVKECEDTHRTAETNRAFAHFTRG